MQLNLHMSEKSSTFARNFCAPMQNHDPERRPDETGRAASA